MDTFTPISSDQSILLARPMAHSLARRLSRGRMSGCTFEDLSARADEALVEAWQRFVPGQGAAFTSYAHPWVRGALLRELERARRHAGREEALLHEPGSLSGAFAQTYVSQVMNAMPQGSQCLVWAHVVEGQPLSALTGRWSESTLRRRYQAALAAARALL